MKNTIIFKHRDGNVTPYLLETLKNLPKTDETLIQFEKGTYRFHKDGSELHAIFASSGSCCDGRAGNVIFPLLNLKNITIDGGGSEFVFCDRFQPFVVQNCENVTLQNFSLDYSFLRYAYADVLNVTNDGVELFINKALSDYKVENGNMCFVCGKETISTKQHKISFKHLGASKSGICFLYVGDIECNLNAAATNVFADAEETKNGVFLRYRKGSPKIDFQLEKCDRMCLAYDNDREYQMFWLDNSKNVTVKNVSIYRNGGMGVVADMCENVTLDGYNVGLKKGRDEYYSSTADAIFITNCRGDFVLKNSSLENTYDDAINIHGYYTKVTRVLDKNKIKISTIHPAHVGLVPAKANDTLVFNDPENGTCLFEARVVDVSFTADRSDITLTLNSSCGVEEGMLIKNITAMPRVLIENNKIIHCPHMRLSAPDMIIRNNVLNLDGYDIYICDLWGFWNEYGATENVEITDNTFGTNARKSIKAESKRPKGHNNPHKSITIKNNTFAKKKEDAIEICDTESCIVETNSFGE